jgi:hypothetical protein
VFPLIYGWAYRKIELKYANEIDKSV